jgi:hypothetical protein
VAAVSNLTLLALLARRVAAGLGPPRRLPGAVRAG